MQTKYKLIVDVLKSFDGKYERFVSLVIWYVPGF